MSLFDKKEEVLNTELTQYGKKMLSKGLFNPTYYGFYDDNVIYDVNYANFSESHTESKSRIKDSITFKPLYSFSNAPNEDKLKFENELGNSGLLSDYAPAWDIKVLNNDFIACSITPPSASMTITYTSQVLPERAFDTPSNSETLAKTSIYDDGYFMKLKRNYVLLDISEINEYEEVGRGKFELEFSTIIDNKEVFLTFEEAKEYLDILCDEEINSFVKCEKISDKGDIYIQPLSGCGNYNGDLIFGKDNKDVNIYNFESNRGEIC